MNQASFFRFKAFHGQRRTEHGGSIGQGRRKGRRPYDPKGALHLVFRSERAHGEWSMLRARYDKRIQHLLEREARRHAIRVYRFANAGNHLHLLVRSSDPASLKRFLRSFAGLVARAITGAKKGRATGRFWAGLVYSRIVSFGREFHRVRDYLIQNELEGLGLIAWKPREAMRP